MGNQEFEIILNGGLGNQLFGWALGYSVSQATGLTCRFNTSRIEGRKFELGAFGIVGYPSRPFQVILPNNRILKRAVMKFPNYLLRRWFVESGFRFQSKFLEPRDRVSYYGYFQSYKYFENYGDQIRGILNLSEQKSGVFEAACTHIREVKPYAVHIRRGDYLGREDFHGLATKGFFDNAIKKVREVDDTATFVLFTDSPELTRDLISGVKYLPQVTDGHSSAETLVLMSKCKGLIGSNSSFSWWAAFLMPPHAIRIFPKPWFVNRSMDTADLLPSGWIQLNNS